ncbi:A24 family peptidase [Comamonas testosteroni]|uniref:A24 family peptidase n=1 Tax=Comamonas testosteroni TaxID=285 RepID=UPI001E3FC7A5|nr:A24 family peptidase [Comamonas testosteroni]
MILIVASAWDIRYRRIPNWLILIGGILGVFSHADILSISPLSVTWGDSLIGILLVIAVLLPFWIAKVMGAGDIKFLIVLSLWLGWRILIPIWVVSVFISIIHLLARRIFSLRRDDLVFDRKRFMPYVAHISMATVAVLMLDK